MMKYLMVLAAIVLPILADNIGKVEIQQDTLGNYHLDIEHPDGNRQEHRNADGSITGSYYLINAEGKPVLVQYYTEDGGFKVKNPAVQIEETAEVRAARAEHLKAHAKQEKTIQNARAKNGLFA